MSNRSLTLVAMFPRFVMIRTAVCSALLFAACLFLTSCQQIPWPNTGAQPSPSSETTVRSLRPPPPPPSPPTPSPAPSPETTAIPGFPWPPPSASAWYTVPNRLLVSSSGSTTLSDVGRRLTRALEEAKYGKWSYSAVPGGFALVTQIEQIKDDGTPMGGPDRFSTDLPSFSNMTFVQFLEAIAKAPPGRYRVIVFIVTDVPLTQAGENPSEDEAQHWLNAGVLQLPESIGLLTYGQNFSTTALVYEFKKRSKTAPVDFVLNSNLLGNIHLEKAGIWYQLTHDR